MYSDLTPEAQARLCSMFNTTPEEENWDTFYLAEISREEDDIPPKSGDEPVPKIISSREAVEDSIRHWQIMVDTAKTCDDAEIINYDEHRYFDRNDFVMGVLQEKCGNRPSANQCALCNEINNYRFLEEPADCDNCILAHFFDDCSKPTNAYQPASGAKSFSEFAEKGEAMVRQLQHCLDCYDIAVK